MHVRGDTGKAGTLSHNVISLISERNFVIILVRHRKKNVSLTMFKDVIVNLYIIYNCLVISNY